jgi:hypothetical protein
MLVQTTLAAAHALVCTRRVMCVGMFMCRVMVVTVAANAGVPVSRRDRTTATLSAHWLKPEYYFQVGVHQK